ncbi:MAG: beta-propeller fold lactonase family protein [Armatimonadetes bacterium]|nr:beta-propeller fold lactonase family protein [Armatimonadota bacterium]
MKFFGSKLAKTAAIMAGVATLTAMSQAQPTSSSANHAVVGAVYSSTNSSLGNQVAVFDRGVDGQLTNVQYYNTGGLGTGSGLGSQGSVTLSQDSRYLYAVNAGSNDFSVFRVKPQGLQFIGKYASGGVRPISVTQSGNLVYVLNAGAPDSIVGFRIAEDGTLSQIANSARPLSGADVAPAQVSFSPDGDLLVVTEKGTNQITSFAVDHNGTASSPVVTASSGQTPFGFGWGKRNRLLVSEAFGGSTNASALSSYNTESDGQVSVISASAPTHQTAACWTLVTRDGRFAYTTNAGSSTVSGFAIDRDGMVSLLDASGQTAFTGANTSPVDIAQGGNNAVYVLTGRTPSIVAYRLRQDGGLETLNTWSLPSAYAGLAAR